MWTIPVESRGPRARATAPCSVRVQDGVGSEGADEQVKWDVSVCFGIDTRQIFFSGKSEEYGKSYTDKILIFIQISLYIKSKTLSLTH